MTTNELSFLSRPLFGRFVFTHPWWLRARALWQSLANLRRRDGRCLRLRESLPLGERRFVAVIEVEHQRLLIGGTASSLVLLVHLDAAPEPPANGPTSG